MKSQDVLTTLIIVKPREVNAIKAGNWISLLLGAVHVRNDAYLRRSPDKRAFIEVCVLYCVEMCELCTKTDYRLFSSWMTA